jgi:hypothetical protein
MQHAARTPPGAIGPADDLQAAAALAAYLGQVAAACPICAADLRRCTGPACPDCGQPLVLTLDDGPPRFGWFLVMLTPACLVEGALFLVLLVILLFGPPPPGAWPMLTLVAALAAIDAAFAVWAYRSRARLLVQPVGRQRLHALAVWALHALVPVGVAVADRLF